MTASIFDIWTICANSDEMQEGLWKDALHYVDMYISNCFVSYMLGTIDMARIRLAWWLAIKWTDGTLGWIKAIMLKFVGRFLLGMRETWGIMEVRI